MKRLAVGLLVGALLLAGCLQPSGPAVAAEAGIDYDAIELAIGTPVVEDHDHADPALHDAHWGLDLVAQVRGPPGRTPPAGEAYLETAVKGGYAYVARTGPDQGLVVFDVTDIENPRYLSYLRLDAGFEADVEVSDDGRWAFWETQRVATSAGLPSVTDPGANAPRGIHVVDLADKAAPQWVSYMPIWPDGPHSITYANLGTPAAPRHILLGSTYAQAYSHNDIPVPGAQRLVILELDTSLPVPRLVQLAEYRDPEAAESMTAPEGGRLPHDVSVATHPVTGRPYAYVAYWDLGIVILDLSDAANPVKVGQATDFGPAPYRKVHMARQFPGTIAGRVVAVAEPELDAQPDSGYVTMFDVTDPTKPAYLSSWLLPGNLTSAGGSLGPHYFDVRDGRIALASYHAGFWVIDVHDEANLLKPRSVAFSLVNATGTSTLPVLGGLIGGANAFDAWWADGTHVAGGDVHGGLSVFRYTGPIEAQEP